MNYQLYNGGTNFYLDCEDKEIFTHPYRSMPANAYHKTAVKLFTVFDGVLVDGCLEGLIESLQPEIQGLQELYLGAKPDAHGNLVGEWSSSDSKDYYAYCIAEKADTLLMFEED